MKIKDLLHKPPHKSRKKSRNQRPRKNQDMAQWHIEHDHENKRKSGITLHEEQVFNIDAKKKNIIDLINRLMNGESLTRMDADQYSPFYDIIRNDISGRVDSYKSIKGLPDGFDKTWLNYFRGSAFVSNGGPWAQVNMDNNKPTKPRTDYTYNLYYTVEKSAQNIVNYFNKFHLLGNYLQELLNELAQKNYGAKVSYKTHAYLDNFVVDNDSFKVYYYDKSLKDELVKTVKKFLNDAGITITTRTHNSGVDIKNSKGAHSFGYTKNENDSMSYGELVANTVTRELKKVIDSHGKKYTAEQYYEWVRKNFSDIIRKINIVEQP